MATVNYNRAMAMKGHELRLAEKRGEIYVSI
jgi:hypothetical protein